MRSDKYKKPPENKSLDFKQTKNNREDLPKNGNGFNAFLKFWAVIYFLAAACFVGTAIYIDLLPAKYLAMGLGATALISIMIIPPLYSCRFKKSRKIIALIFSVIFIFCYGLGVGYLTGTMDFFSKVTDAEKVQTEDYYVIVKDDSEYKKIDDIKGKEVQTFLTNELNYSEAKGKLKKKENVQYEMIENLSDLADGLMKEDYDVIFISAAHYTTVCSEHQTFEDDTRILYTVKVEIEAKDISKDVNVTEEPYNIYVSGLDVEGTIDVTSRSDVNMIVTVNPKTHTVLLTSIPRDYYIKLPNKGNAGDKLTHTGIYGIGETVASVEKLMGIDINYYVKVNYTTVTKFVDAIDGVDVDSDFYFTTHGMKSHYTFYKGMNHLDGSKALAFARERKSFEDGDVQRNKNQQKVIEAMIKKATSSTTILSSYTNILNSVENNVEINMTAADIKKIVKNQLEDMPSWKIKKQNLEGTGMNSQCYSTGDYFVYVMKPDNASVVSAVDQITAVMDGNDTDSEGSNQEE